jgi:hypothetical protein
MIDVARFDCVMSKSLATTTTVILCFLVAFLLAMVALFWWIGARTGWPAHVVKLGAAVSLLLTASFATGVFFSWAYAPRVVAVDGATITVDRLLSPIVIPLATVKGLRPVTAQDFAGTIRTMGSDGLFARIGRFHSPALGNFRMYLTDGADAVLVEADERYVLSPAGSERFIAAVRAGMAPAPVGGDG